MQENDFFTWRRAMLLRFQEMAAAEDVYTELQYQTQRLEFDYYALCVRHPVPFTRPKISLRTTYPPAWVTHYQSENYFAIDPVLKPENFRQGHLHWDDVLFHEAQAMGQADAGRVILKMEKQIAQMDDEAQAAVFSSTVKQIKQAYRVMHIFSSFFVYYAYFTR